MRKGRAQHILAHESHAHVRIGAVGAGQEGVEDLLVEQRVIRGRQQDRAIGRPERARVEGLEHARTRGVGRAQDDDVGRGHELGAVDADPDRADARVTPKQREHALEHGLSANGDERAVHRAGGCREGILAGASTGEHDRVMEPAHPSSGTAGPGAPPRCPRPPAGLHGGLRWRGRRAPALAS